MNSLTDLVEVVIGVDTHLLTHTAAIVDAGTGGVLAQVTVDATAAGYTELLGFAEEHPRLRAWAVEGTGGHGAGLTRHLEHHHELVVELDRPNELAAATVRGLIRWTRSAPRAKHCPAPI